MQARMHVRTHAYTHVYTHVRLHACMHVCDVCAHTCVLAHTHVQMLQRLGTCFTHFERVQDEDEDDDEDETVEAEQEEVTPQQVAEDPSNTPAHTHAWHILTHALLCDRPPACPYAGKDFAPLVNWVCPALACMPRIQPRHLWFVFSDASSGAAGGAALKCKSR